MIEKRDIENIANLSNLKLNDNEIDTFTRQLNDIVRYVKKVDEFDTDGVVPTGNIVLMKNVVREDKVEPSMDREKVLANAAEKKNGHFKVPKIMDD